MDFCFTAKHSKKYGSLVVQYKINIGDRFTLEVNLDIISKFYVQSDLWSTCPLWHFEDHFGQEFGDDLQSDFWNDFVG